MLFREVDPVAELALLFRFFSSLSRQSRRMLSMEQRKAEITEEDVRQYLAKHVGAKHHGWFSDIEGELVAWAPVWLNWGLPHLYELGLAVGEEWRHRGWGTELWRRVMAVTEDEDPAAWFRIRVHPKNWRMRRLIAKLGFRQIAPARRKRMDFERPMRKEALFSLIRDFTMIKYGALENLYDLTQRLDSEWVPGAIVQCGVWRGGTAAMFAHLCPMRRMWLFDSFAPLREIKAQVGDQDNLSLIARKWPRAATPGHISQILGKIGAQSARMHLVEGWFEDTLPVAKPEVGPIALLHVDCDWYEPTRLVLDTFYDDVAYKGIVVLDDHGWNVGCKEAFEDFFDERDESHPSLTDGKRGSVWWAKARW